MTKATTLTVTLPNGELAKRKTARTYTHVVCAKSWAYSWASSLELAEKALKSTRGMVGEFTIVPVNS